jgi:hypothetical protein
MLRCTYITCLVYPYVREIAIVHIFTRVWLCEQNQSAHTNTRYGCCALLASAKCDSTGSQLSPFIVTLSENNTWLLSFLAEYERSVEERRRKVAMYVRQEYLDD